MSYVYSKEDTAILFEGGGGGMGLWAIMPHGLPTFIRWIHYKPFKMRSISLSHPLPR